MLLLSSDEHDDDDAPASLGSLWSQLCLSLPHGKLTLEAKCGCTRASTDHGGQPKEDAHSIEVPKKSHPRLQRLN